MNERHIVPAAGGVGLRLRRGQQLRVIDPEGGQSGDLVAFSHDGRERLSNGRTFDYGGTIYVSTGSTPLNVFMNVDVVEGGRLVFAPPRSRAGDAIVLRAEMDLAIALSSCPASLCNAGAPPRPLAFEIAGA